MKLNRNLRIVQGILLCIVSVVSRADHACAADVKAAPSGMLHAASDGKGEIRLLLLYPFGKWPGGGWRIEEIESRRVVKEMVTLGDAAELQKAGAATRKDVEKLISDLAAAKDGKTRDLLYAFSMGRVLTDWEYAQALGLGFVITDAPAGQRRYRAVGLDAKGHPTAVRLESKPVDGSVASSLPEAPRNGRAESRPDGVSLFWQPHEKPGYQPVLGYLVERSWEGGAVVLTEKPLMVSPKTAADQAAFVDRDAPKEQQVRYAIFSLDSLGRKSRASVVEVFHEDFAATVPPVGLTVSGDAQARDIGWQPGGNAGTTAYLVERSVLLGGPYEVLTPAGLPPDTKRFRDPAPLMGDAYYRVRAVGPRGNVGAPSGSVLVAAKNAAPPKPEGLRLEPGITRIILTWEMTPGAVGYIVERRVDGKEWIPLNSILFDEPRYEDHIGRADGRRYDYRVSAVAYGDAKSPASSVVSVTLPDAAPPDPPRILSASGADGRSRIEFVPAPPEEDSASFLVLRGADEKEIGLVIGDPLPGKARSFEDGWVNTGETYWYRLVAVDAAGNRSDPGAAVAVRISRQSIPIPAAPRVSFEEKPFVHVKISFDQPPSGLSVMVEGKSSAETRWRHIAGPLSGTEALDAAPAGEGMQYRLRYLGGSDRYGDPSPLADLSRGKR